MCARVLAQTKNNTALFSYSPSFGGRGVVTSLFVLKFPPLTAVSKIRFPPANRPTTIFLCNSQFIHGIDEYIFFFFPTEGQIKLSYITSWCFICAQGLAASVGAEM